jgi:hypothetical protein
MKTINNYITEKIKLSDDRFNKIDIIPAVLNKSDIQVIEKYYNLVKKIAKEENFEWDDRSCFPSKDFTHIIDLLKKEMPKKYQTPEMIWGYIVNTLGWISYLDDEDDERYYDGYLSQESAETDPIFEFVYRAIEEITD